MANIFDKVVSGLNKGVTSVSEGSKVIVEKARLNTQLSDIQKEQEQLYLDLGRTVYRKCRNNELTLDSCQGILNSLKEKEKIITNLNNRINALNEMQKEQDQILSADITVCPYCGKANKNTAKFCSGCGKSLRSAEPESETAAVPEPETVTEEVPVQNNTEIKEGED